MQFENVFLQNKLGNNATGFRQNGVIIKERFGVERWVRRRVEERGGANLANSKLILLSHFRMALNLILVIHFAKLFCRSEPFRIWFKDL